MLGKGADGDGMGPRPAVKRKSFAYMPDFGNRGGRDERSSHVLSGSLAPRAPQNGVMLGTSGMYRDVVNWAGGIGTCARGGVVGTICNAGHAVQVSPHTLTHTDMSCRIMDG